MVLCGIPHKLLYRIQWTQNHAAQEVFRLTKYSHITPALVTLSLISTWCRIYASVNRINIVSDKCLSPVRRKTITWTNVALLLIIPFGTNFNEIWIKIQNWEKPESSYSPAMDPGSCTRLASCSSHSCSVPILWNILLHKMLAVSKWN